MPTSRDEMDEKPKDQPDPSAEAAGKDPKQEPAGSRPKPRLVDITEQVLGRVVVISGSKSSKTR